MIKMNKKKVILGDYISTVKGYAFKSKWYCDEGIPIVKVTNFTEDSISNDALTYISKIIAENYTNVSLEENDVIIQTVGSWPSNPKSVVGKVIKTPKNMVGAFLNQNAVKIIPNESIDKKYLYYILKDNSFKNYIIGTAQGSASQASITLKAIKGFYINYFELDYQKKIVAILSAYDELIETYFNRIIILEKIAKLLFDEWFINFRFPGHKGVEIRETANGSIPNGWKCETLGSVVDNIKVNETSGKHLQSLYYLPIECIEKKSLFLKEKKNWNEAKSSLIRFRKKDILFGAMRPYFHKVTVAPFDGITRTTCFVLRPKNREYYAYLVMSVFQESTIKYATNRSQGSTIPYTVWKNGLEKMPLIIPDENTLNNFNEILNPIIDEIINTHFIFTLLNELRNLLLPKFISGEIDVTDIDT